MNLPVSRCIKMHHEVGPSRHDKRVTYPINDRGVWQTSKMGIYPGICACEIWRRQDQHQCLNRANVAMDEEVEPNWGVLGKGVRPSGKGEYLRDTVVKSSRCEPCAGGG
jgi:hypothetical protein